MQKCGSGTAVMIAAFPVWLPVYVPDVDETYRKALAARGVDPEKAWRREGSVWECLVDLRQCLRRLVAFQGGSG